MASPSKDTQIAPFLSKCYAMVDDPATDSIVSWSCTGTSFVIWDVPKLQEQILPMYYKHANFSSFNRQLNQYGFRKVDSDRWEFTNDWFIKGQKHMLNYITRKKASSQGSVQPSQAIVSNTIMGRNSSQSNSQQSKSQEIKTSSRMKPSNGNCVQNHPREKILSRRITSQVNNEENPSQENDSFAGACVEVGDFRIWEEVELLKKDKNVVMQELTKLSHNQKGADSKLHLLGERLEGMELSQQQMLSFLVMVVQKPGFLGKLLQQNDSHWHISETNKKRPYLALDQDAAFDEHLSSDAQIVRYQPVRNETPKPLLLLPPPSSDEVQGVDPSATGFDDFFTHMDLMDAEQGTPLPMEEGGQCGNVGQIVIPDVFDEGMLERLLDGPYSASVEPQSVARLAEELGMLLDDEDENS